MEYISKTADISETWHTAEIGAYLHDTGLFPADSLTVQQPFLGISLRCVRN